ncbi:MAG TPA: sodium:solute symporter family protein [Candidatus Hydrogenedentes bacterium]|nr:sodium:solute symporter family protein [Candidatus Hydrogenedentota bacterium]HRK35054.1 sodium:solute symporter family protein [Candidatus Hydrogenedentota bacterium]
MNGVLIGLSVYVLIQLAIGLYVSRWMRNETDYLLAGKRFGLGIATMSIFATWFGSETCIGSSGAVYEEGLSGSKADPFGYTLCLLLMGLVFAVPLYRRQLTTLGDLFRQRYGGGVEKIAVLVIIPSSLLWAGAQIRAFGHVISASSEIAPAISIAVAAAVVIVYTSSGGLLADAVTDLIQGTVLILGLVVVLVVAVYSLGGIGEAYRGIEPERFTFLRADGSLLEQMDGWAVPIFGSVLAQELISRTLASRNESIARNAALSGAAVYFCVGSIPVILGLLGPALMPDLEDPEQLLPSVAMNLLHPVLYVVFAGALISAILSTVDSALLAASALTSHNIIVPLRKNMTERHKVRAARYCVVAFGVLAYLFAIREGSVYEQVEEASAFGSAGILVVGVFALFTRFGGKLAAGAALITGSISYLIASYTFELGYPYITAIVSSLAVYCLFAPFGKGLTQEFEPKSA